MNQNNPAEKKVLSEYTITCDRCEGSGYLPQYKHVQNGVYFKCSGNGQLIKKRIIYEPFSF